MIPLARRLRHGLVAVRCPDCARSDNAAEVLTISAHVQYQVLEDPVIGDGRAVIAGGKCERCGKRWYVKLLTPAA